MPPHLCVLVAVPFISSVLGTTCLSSPAAVLVFLDGGRQLDSSLPSYRYLLQSQHILNGTQLFSQVCAVSVVVFVTQEELTCVCALLLFCLFFPHLVVPFH